MQSTLAALQHEAVPCTSVPSLAPVSSGDPCPGHGYVCGTEHLNATQLCSLLAKLGVHPSGGSSPNPSAPLKAPQAWAELAGTGHGQYRVKHLHLGPSPESKEPPLSCKAVGPWILLLSHLFQAEVSGPGCGHFSWHSRCLLSVIS